MRARTKCIPRLSLCVLSVLCVSVVCVSRGEFTTETQRSQRVLSRNQILAPEEPNVYSTALNRTTRAPAERNGSEDDCAGRASFAPLERGEPFWSRPFYKHFGPT